MPKESVMKPLPGGDTNLLEEYVFGKPEVPKREKRMVLSEKARQHRADLKALQHQRSIKGIHKA